MKNQKPYDISKIVFAGVDFTKSRTVQLEVFTDNVKREEINISVIIDLMSHYYACKKSTNSFLADCGGCDPTGFMVNQRIEIVNKLLVLEGYYSSVCDKASDKLLASGDLENEK